MKSGESTHENKVYGSIWKGTVLLTEKAGTAFQSREPKVSFKGQI